MRVFVNPLEKDHVLRASKFEVLLAWWASKNIQNKSKSLRKSQKNCVELDTPLVTVFLVWQWRQKPEVPLDLLYSILSTVCCYLPHFLSRNATVFPAQVTHLFSVSMGHTVRVRTNTPNWYTMYRNCLHWTGMTKLLIQLRFRFGKQLADWIILGRLDICLESLNGHIQILEKNIIPSFKFWDWNCTQQTFWGKEGGSL